MELDSDSLSFINVNFPAILLVSLRLLSKIDNLVIKEMNQWKHADGIDENGSIIIKSKITYKWLSIRIYAFITII